jgi:DNA-binding NarL/FixJ family response regulator
VHRLLLVDDDPDYRLVLRLALSAHPGFEVVGEAGGADEAVEAAARLRPNLVVLDCRLGASDAFDVLPRLRQAAPEAHAVLLSGHDQVELEAAARAAGTIGYLRKGSPVARLPAELATVAGVADAVRAALACDARSAREARALVADALDSWGMAHLTETATLLVSELVTNAVVHARSDVQVIVRLVPSGLRVEVFDASPAVPVPRVAAPEDVSGRGLDFVDTMSTRWGVDHRGDDGKVVWFEVARDHVPG